MSHRRRLYSLLALTALLLTPSVALAGNLCAGLFCGVDAAKGEGCPMMRGMAMPEPQPATAEPATPSPSCHGEEKAAAAPSAPAAQLVPDCCIGQAEPATGDTVLVPATVSLQLPDLAATAGDSTAVTAQATAGWSPAAPPPPPPPHRTLHSTLLI